jgi:hypothetical protein
MTGRRDVLRIGNCSGFFGDRQSAACELVEAVELDVLTGDWLAELTMTILHRQRSRDPLKGYASTFLGQVEEVLGSCIDKGVRIVSNAGGLNPAGCAHAVSDLAARLGLQVTVGHVLGDDVVDRLPRMVADGVVKAFDSEEPWSLDGRIPEVANAYLGGWGIASCLSRGANVVVTGRVTDAALVVGSGAWAFDWQVNDWDALAGAVVAGHLIECGTQVTGGNYAFYQQLPHLTRLGFPIAELHADGSSVITKAATAAGLVSVDTVTAQLLYEIGSTRYANPDVTARLDTVRLTEVGPSRVQVTGVRGEPPPPSLKVSIAVPGGFRNSMVLAITGEDAETKAALAQQAIWDLVPGGREAFDDIEVELLGRPVADASTQADGTCLLRIAVAGRDRALVGRTFSAAVVATGLASYPGFYTGSPPTDAVSYATYRPALIPASACSSLATVADDLVVVPSTGAIWSRELDPVADRNVVVNRPPVTKPQPGASSETTAEPTMRVALGTVIGARSGDKGGDANLGVWVRDPRHYTWLDEKLTIERLRTLIPQAAELTIRRYRLPNLGAVNFVLERFLGDGVSSCLRFDAQAKGLAEFLRSRYIDVPRSFLPDSARQKSDG